jgi:hypothetical protein
MILLTSFRNGEGLVNHMPVWSAAVYQPRGIDFPKAQWADIRDENGVWTRPRNFVDQPRPLVSYKEALWTLYSNREEEIAEWLRENHTDEVAMCCWCPYDRAAQRQLKEWGSFVCHTAVMGLYLENIFEIEVHYDGDRDRMVKFEFPR